MSLLLDLVSEDRAPQQDQRKPRRGLREIKTSSSQVAESRTGVVTPGPSHTSLRSRQCEERGGIGTEIAFLPPTTRSTPLLKTSLLFGSVSLLSCWEYFAGLKAEVA